MESTFYPGRRLADELSTYCGGAASSTHLQTTLLNAELHFHLFDDKAPHGLWGAKPLVGHPRLGAVRLRCSPSEDLQSLRNAYEGLTLEPLVKAIRPHNGRRPFAPLADGVALLVLPDYENLFHQFGSFAIAWAAYQDSLRTQPPTAAEISEPPVSVFMLSNTTLTPTALFWSHSFAGARPPTFVRASPAAATTFRRVVLVQPAIETWWWNVWKPDPTDRRATFRPLVESVVRRLLPQASHDPVVRAAIRDAQAMIDAAAALLNGAKVTQPPQLGLPLAPAADGREVTVALLVRRPAGTDRRILNDVELARGLVPVLPPGMVTRLVDLTKLTTRAQLALVRRCSLLIGAHGVGATPPTALLACARVPSAS